MNNKEWIYVLALASERSISKAAEKLYLTQPALSLFLSRLEAQLGVELFTRNKNGLVPTYAGEYYIQMIHKMVNLQENFEQELCEINKMQKGRLKIGTSVHIGSLVLPEVLPLFQRKYPNVDVLITEGSSEKLESLLENSEVDISLMHLPLKSIQAEYEIICKDRYVLAFAQGHPLAKEAYYKQDEKYPYLDLTKAGTEKFILSFPGQRVRQISNLILEKAGIEPDVTLVTSSVQTALRFASVGLGMTLLPESYIQLFRCPREPFFCYLEDWYEAYWTFVIAYPKGNVLSTVVRNFIDTTKNLFSKDRSF